MVIEHESIWLNFFQGVVGQIEKWKVSQIATLTLSATKDMQESMIEPKKILIHAWKDLFDFILHGSVFVFADIQGSLWLLFIFTKMGHEEQEKKKKEWKKILTNKRGETSIRISYLVRIFYVGIFRINSVCYEISASTI